MDADVADEMIDRRGPASFAGAATDQHTPRSGVRTGQSSSTDTRIAVAELYSAVEQQDMDLVLFFCSRQYDLAALADEVNRRFAGVHVVGCTTAGEIGPAGCLDNSISGVSFSAAAFDTVSATLTDLRRSSARDAAALTQDLLQRLEQRKPDASDENTFALLLIDGLTGREEPVTRTLQHLLGDIQLVGGSAGDGVRFDEALVFADGQFRSDSAVVVLASTSMSFRPFKLQHFVATAQRVVITQADGASRTVTEIDGLPAATAYADLVDVEIESLGPMLFAAQPMVVLIDGTNYVRSIRSANADGSLTFFSSVEEGLVLRSACGVDIVENLEHGLAEIRESIDQLEVVIGFDCILRRMEYGRLGLLDRVERSMRANRVVGFNCYGEQYRGVHINQTMTGVAIGRCADV